MDVKIVKMTRSFINPHFIFCDFLVFDKILLKGLCFDESKHSLHLPMANTQGQKKYTVITFPNVDDHLLFLKTALDLLKEAERPQKTEELTDEQKIALRRQYSAIPPRRSYFRRGFKRGGARPQENKIPPKTLPKDLGKEAAARIRSSPAFKGNITPTLPNLRGKGFVTLPPRKTKS